MRVGRPDAEARAEWRRAVRRELDSARPDRTAGHPAMRMLVTGGAGFIGANVVHQTRREHPEHSVTVLDALTYVGNEASLAPVRGGVEFVRRKAAIRFARASFHGPRGDVRESLTCGRLSPPPPG